MFISKEDIERLINQSCTGRGMDELKNRFGELLSRISNEVQMMNSSDTEKLPDLVNLLALLATRTMYMNIDKHKKVSNVAEQIIQTNPETIKNPILAPLILYSLSRGTSKDNITRDYLARVPAETICAPLPWHDQLFGFAVCYYMDLMNLLGIKSVDQLSGIWSHAIEYSAAKPMLTTSYNMQRIVEIEETQPGITDYLYENRKLTMLGRYPKEWLIEQPKLTAGQPIMITAADDPTDEFMKNDLKLLNPNTEVIPKLFEAENIHDVINALINEPDHSIPYIVIRAHGDPNRMQMALDIMINWEDFNLQLTPVIKNKLKPGGKVYILSCYTDQYAQKLNLPVTTHKGEILFSTTIEFGKDTLITESVEEISVDDAYQEISAPLVQNQI